MSKEKDKKKKKKEDKLKLPKKKDVEKQIKRVSKKYSTESYLYELMEELSSVIIYISRENCNTYHSNRARTFSLASCISSHAFSA